MFAGTQAEVLRDAKWCNREGQARLLELMEEDGTAGRSSSPAARSTSPTAASTAFCSAACAWRSPISARAAPGCTTTTRGGDRQGAANRRAAPAFPGAHDDTLVRENKVDIGAGDRRRRVGHAGRRRAGADGPRASSWSSSRPFLGGRAARIGTVFPTNDCGQCLPTTDAQAGTRKCFHRNVAIDNPNLHIWRRTSVESVGGEPRRLRGLAAPAAEHRHAGLRQLRHLRGGLPGRERRGRTARRSSASSTTAAFSRYGRPRGLHLLRRLRRDVPGRRDRLHVSRRSWRR